MELTLIQKIALYALPVLFAITVHEAAHGYAARYFGDLTAEQAGRISLNPLRHIDLLGTVILPVLMITATGFLFGWAKPVPVNFSRLRNPKKDMLWVAAAGPLANLAMAIGWALLLGFTRNLPDYFGFPLSLMANAGVLINSVLFLFNLLPLPPLDGGRIAVSLLPWPSARYLASLEPYGLLIVVGLMFSGVLNQMLSPLLKGTVAIILGLFF